MPAGIENPELGYLGYAAIKFAGYSLAAALISRKYERDDRNPWLIGGVRTLIGMAAGAVCYGLTGLIPALQPAGGIVFLIGIIPVRIAEWWLLLWLFFDRELKQTQKGWRTVATGLVWSFVLDVPALIGFLLAGGFWIC